MFLSKDNVTNHTLRLRKRPSPRDRDACTETRDIHDSHRSNVFFDDGNVRGGDDLALSPALLRDLLRGPLGLVLRPLLVVPHLLQAILHLAKSGIPRRLPLLRLLRALLLNHLERRTDDGSSHRLVGRLALLRLGRVVGVLLVRLSVLEGPCELRRLLALVEKGLALGVQEEERL